MGALSAGHPFVCSPPSRTGEGLGVGAPPTGGSPSAEGRSFPLARGTRFVGGRADDCADGCRRARPPSHLVPFLDRERSQRLWSLLVSRPGHPPLANDWRHSHACSRVLPPETASSPCLGRRRCPAPPLRQVPGSSLFGTRTQSLPHALRVSPKARWYRCHEELHRCARVPRQHRV